MNALETAITRKLEGRLQHDFLVKIVRRPDQELRGNHYPGFLFPEKMQADTIHFLLLEKTLDSSPKSTYSSPENQLPVPGNPGIVSLTDLLVKYMMPRTGISGREISLWKASPFWVLSSYSSVHPPVPTPPPKVFA